MHHNYVSILWFNIRGRLFLKKMDIDKQTYSMFIDESNPGCIDALSVCVPLAHVFCLLWIQLCVTIVFCVHVYYNLCKLFMGE